MSQIFGTAPRPHPRTAVGRRARRPRSWREPLRRPKTFPSFGAPGRGSQIQTSGGWSGGRGRLRPRPCGAIPAASLVPSGENAKERTTDRGPMSIARTFRVAVSMTITEWSMPPVATARVARSRVSVAFRARSGRPERVWSAPWPRPRSGPSHHHRSRPAGPRRARRRASESAPKGGRSSSSPGRWPRPRAGCRRRSARAPRRGGRGSGPSPIVASNLPSGAKATARPGPAWARNVAQRGPRSRPRVSRSDRGWRRPASGRRGE